VDALQLHQKALEARSEQQMEALLEAQEATRHHAAELSTVIRSIPEGIFLGNPRGDIECNEAAVRMLGEAFVTTLRRAPERLAADFGLRYPEEDLPFESRDMPFFRAIEGEARVVELVAVHSETRRLIHVRCASAPIVERGRIAGTVAVVTDITEAKRLEEALLASREDLEHLVQERTAELTRANDQLSLEMAVHREAETSLRTAYSAIEELKDHLEAENTYLARDLGQRDNFGEFVGQSPALQEVFFRIEAVAPQDITVLLLGETGTGKGVMARNLHCRSARKDRPLVKVNCTALPASLIESELFGREKGAFTGASHQQIGRFELADKGTLFLDEIGELPLELQAKLLHVIQDKEFSRLGSPRTLKVDVRIIAATNRDLQEEMRQGRFREDLFYRLNVFPITIPPLRQRKEDIPLLVNLFLDRCCREMGKKIERISNRTMERLLAHHWPGNVRELESVIARAVITSQGLELQVLDRFESPPKDAEEEAEAECTLAERERAYILKVLLKTHWRVDGKDGAARLLGMNPSTLRGRMRHHGIFRP
jgi:transcriptional regulator with GAF, ATPase, and Fis domain